MFLKDNYLLSTKHLATFSCDGFWSCANKDDALERALRFLKDDLPLGTKKRATFSCGLTNFSRDDFWSCVNKDTTHGKEP
jgi:hypothetical protein